MLKPMWQDADLLRFLRARDFNIGNASAMLKATVVSSSCSFSLSGFSDPVLSVSSNSTFPYSEPGVA